MDNLNRHITVDASATFYKEQIKKNPKKPTILKLIFRTVRNIIKGK